VLGVRFERAKCLASVSSEEERNEEERCVVTTWFKKKSEDSCVVKTKEELFLSLDLIVNFLYLCWLPIYFLWYSWNMLN
jgi:hypothetical protein